jgi:hypothetical protein
MKLNDEYMTPEFPYIQAVRDVFGGQIDLDPASTPIANERIKAKTFYTAHDNGLDHENEWHGKVFINPPFSKIGGASQIRLWFERLEVEYSEGNIEEGILLGNMASGSKWFRPILHWPMCFPLRIKFDAPPGLNSNSPRYDNFFVYVGPVAKFAIFAKCFKNIGITKI